MPVVPILSSSDDSSSNLRARLSSQPPPSRPKASSSSSSSSLKKPNEGDDLFHHFRACFVPAPTAPVSTYTRLGPTSNDGLIQALGESAARDAFTLHSAVVQDLSRAQTQILAKIASFSQSSSAALASLDTTYANIACPLAATLCHSTHFPRTTLAAHLAAMRDKLDAAERELDALHAEWDDSVREEDRITKELAVDAARAPAQQDATGQMEAFRVEAEGLAREQIQALDDIEARFMEMKQANMIEMLRSIMRED